MLVNFVKRNLFRTREQRGSQRKKGTFIYNWKETKEISETCNEERRSREYNTHRIYGSKGGIGKQRENYLKTT